MRCAKSEIGSGCVLPTITTATCVPRAFSKAASFASSACLWPASSVPVVSVTRASGGTASVPSGSRASAAAAAGGSSATSASSIAAAARRPMASARSWRTAARPATGYFFGVPKSTVGAFWTAASFSTVNCAFSL